MCEVKELHRLALITAKRVSGRGGGGAQNPYLVAIRDLSDRELASSGVFMGLYTKG